MYGTPGQLRHVFEARHYPLGQMLTATLAQGLLVAAGQYLPRWQGVHRPAPTRSCVGRHSKPAGQVVPSLTAPPSDDEAFQLLAQSVVAVKPAQMSHDAAVVAHASSSSSALDGGASTSSSQSIM